MDRFLLACLGSLAISACATVPPATYTAPTPKDYSNTITVNRDFSQTWENLIGYASQTFFAIENFEKDSGLLTLSFGSGNVSRFVDCGYCDRRFVLAGGPADLGNVPEGVAR